MKKILLALLLMFGSASAGDFSLVTIRDSLVPADTLAQALRADTAYSDIANLGAFRGISFFKNLYAGDGIYTDTNFIDDTFFVDVQHSFDMVTWRTWLVDTALTVDGRTWSGFEVDILVDDSLIGNFWRARLIHWDSTEAASEDMDARVYVTNLRLYYNIIK